MSAVMRKRQTVISECKVEAVLEALGCTTYWYSSNYQKFNETERDLGRSSIYRYLRCDAYKQ